MDPKSSNNARGNPPPLPPRQSSSTGLSPYTDPPPSYDSIAMQDNTDNSNAEEEVYDRGPWSTQDPRSSSTQSLTPSENNEQNERRKLLLIYIHGFMGNETSFRSFPAHVHNLLTVLMRETHVVHTKIYPRYQSRNKMYVARDNFSKWLQPHEDEKTDIVLLGHSMGGLLSAEVVLMPPPAPANRPLKHRILGNINFDVPFLGMHPGVVKSGLASMFKSEEAPGDKWTPAGGAAATPDGAGRSDTLWSPEQDDPNYNPSFNNDVVLPMRKGWSSAWHFVNKHSSDLFLATRKLVTSHMEFGGAMANYPELKARYGRIRALEEADSNVRKSVFKSSEPPSRVRFVNYYTASTGRPKKPQSPRKLSPSANASQASLGKSERDVGNGVEHSRSPSPRISVEEHSNGDVVKKDPEIPESDDDEAWEQAAESLTIRDETAEIPDLPSPPPPLNVDFIQDVHTRKLVEEEHDRALKAYEEAVKERGKARPKQQQQQQQKDAEKAAKKKTSQAQQQQNPDLTHSEKEHLRLEQERKRMEAEERRMKGSPSPPAPPSTPPKKETPPPPPPPKDRKFCTLPPKDSHGARDPAWVRVFMADVDEVGAHCGLFFVDERYERLVGEVAGRVEGWVREAGF